MYNHTSSPSHLCCCCCVLLLMVAAAAGERCSRLRLKHLICCRHLAAAWINSRLKSSATPPTAAAAAAAAVRATWLQWQQLALAQQRGQSCLFVSQLWCQLGPVEHSCADGVTVRQTANVWGNVAVCMCVTCWYMCSLKFHSNNIRAQVGHRGCEAGRQGCARKG